jgi:hypothetical protein
MDGLRGEPGVAVDAQNPRQHCIDRSAGAQVFVGAFLAHHEEQVQFFEQEPVGDIVVGIQVLTENEKTCFGNDSGLWHELLYMDDRVGAFVQPGFGFSFRVIRL